jgi:hypothetical protein
MENPFGLLDEDDLQVLWEQHRKNLGILERQAAAHGMDVPLAIISNITFTKEKLTLLGDEFARRNISPYMTNPAKNRGRQLYNIISLNDRQRELLTQLVDVVQMASEPGSFAVMETNESLSASIMFIGAPRHRLTGYMVDLRALARVDLIDLRSTGRTPNVDVRAEGEEYVAYLKFLQSDTTP